MRKQRSDCDRPRLTHACVHALVQSIPAGCVATYGQIARLAGFPRHARQIGYALAALGAGSGVPWHRVVNAGGRISERGAGAAEQRRRLEAEGVEFDLSGRIDVGRYQWRADPVRDACP